MCCCVALVVGVLAELRQMTKMKSTCGCSGKHISAEVTWSNLALQHAVLVRDSFVILMVESVWAAVGFG